MCRDRDRAGFHIYSIAEPGKYRNFAMKNKKIIKIKSPTEIRSVLARKNTSVSMAEFRNKLQTT